jgi:hypothetical protein
VEGEVVTVAGGSAVGEMEVGNRFGFEYKLQPALKNKKMIRTLRFIVSSIN